MKKLEQILLSKYFIYFLIIFISLYVIILTKGIKYQTKIDNFNQIKGRIIEAKISNNYLIFILKSNELIKCNYKLKNKIKVENLIGKKVIINGKKKDINNNTIPNTFNYKKYLYNNKIYNIIDVNQIKIIKNENIFYKIKNRISQRINSFDNKTKSYLHLFILGNKDYLDSNIYHTYQNNGIWHLFAISGMHVGLLIYILDKIFKYLKRKHLIISLFLFFYMFLTNFSASIIRVSLFYYLKKIFNYFNIQISDTKVIIIDAAIILLFKPFFIYDIGFLYSFIISYTIIKNSSKIKGNYFIKIFKISLLATIVSLPITININYEINILSLLLNIIFVPFITLIFFPICFLTFIFPFFQNILNFLIIILELLNKLFSNISLNFIIPKMPIILIIIYYLFILLYLEIQNRKYLYLNIIIILLNIFINKIDANYYVYYLDVNQGDSAILISPNREEVIMIDTGGVANSDYHISDNTILFLKSLGIRKIDLMIITHGDIDHGKEALNIIPKFKVKNIILNNGPKNKLELQISKIGNIKKSYISKNFDYQILNKYYNNDENYSSIITYLKIFNYYFLFMGDAPKEIERKLINDYDLKCNFLKLGHHGSKTSSDIKFLNNYNIQYAIISCGRNNFYHHPAKETINNLNSLKIKYLRTDQNGTIEVKIRKNNYTIKTFSP